MALACKGKVVGKTVILEDGAELPEGARVEVRLLPEVASPLSDDERQQILQRLFAMNLPVADWEQMEEEIIRGALQE
jgi:hypothetical protein